MIKKKNIKKKKKKKKKKKEYKLIKLYIKINLFYLI